MLDHLPDVTSLSDVTFRGVFEPSSAAIIAGYRNSTAQSLSQHLDAFYTEQLEQNAPDLAGLQEELTGPVDGDPPGEGDAEALVEAIAGEQRLKAALEQRGAFISGFTARLSLEHITEAIESAGSSVKELRLLTPPGSDDDPEFGRPDVLSEMLTDAEVTRSASAGDTTPLAEASALVPGQPTCNGRDENTDDNAPRYYAPRRIAYRVTYYGGFGTVALRRKRASMSMRWTEPRSLSWYCGDDNGDRGIEPETKVQVGPRWGTDQENAGWKSNLPEAYLDDLNGGPAAGFKKDRYPDFSVGSGNGQALRYNKLYYTRNSINRGETDSGRVVARMQAVNRSGKVADKIYCFGKGQNRDSHCFFANRTCIVGVNDIPMPRVRRLVMFWAVQESERCD